jgi:hypothetical protein
MRLFVYINGCQKEINHQKWNNSYLFFNEEWKMKKMESETLAVTHLSSHKSTLHIEIFLVLKKSCYKKIYIFIQSTKKKFHHTKSINRKK